MTTHEVPADTPADDAPAQEGEELAAPRRNDLLEPRRVLLHRAVVQIQPGRIEVGPPRSAMIAPAIGFALTAVLLAAMVTWTESLPFFLLPVMLLISVIVLPLSGLSFVYAVFGANVVADRDGQNFSFKQRFLGLGVGTNELVPFWKIRELVVEDVGRAQRHAVNDEPAHEIAQWQIVLVKKSGKRLPLGGYNVPRAREEEGLDIVMDVAEALAALSGATIRGPIW